jgi:hypothetical protein
MIPVSFADDQTSGEWLKEKGLIQGYTDGSLGENDALTRAQLMVLLSQMYNVYEDAKAYPIPSSFTDVPADAWYTPYVAYAQHVGQWTKGYEQADGTFKFMPSKTVSDKELATFMLRALGHEVTDFNNSVAQAKEVGFEVKAGAELNRGDAFAAMATVVKEVPKKGEEKALGYDLGVLEPEVVEPEVAAVKIDSAVAKNSKVVEVALSEEGTVVDATVFTVKDEDGKAVEVTKAEFAGWDSDKETVIITLGDDTVAGTLYTVTSGETMANFGGLDADEDEPTLTEATSTDYNEVELTFGEAIDLSTLEVKLTEKYGDKDALEVLKMEYDGSDKVVLTTADQTESTLYKVEVTAVADLAGNAIEDSLSDTFVGIDKPTDDQTLASADMKSDSSTVVIATFGQKVDPATGEDVANYTVKEKYGDKKEIEVVEAAIDSDDETKVELTLATDTEESTLYELTVKNVKSVYDTSLDGSESDSFTGNAKDEDELSTVDAEATSNTEVTVTFDDNVDEDTAASMFTIKEQYGDKAELAILDIDIDDKVVTLTTEKQKESTLYMLTVAEGIMDDEGNATEEDLEDSFAGKAVADAVSAINSAKLGEDTELVVTFDQFLGDNAEDISLYKIDGDVGYPSKVELNADNKKQVTLTVPKTENGELYELTVSKKIMNSDGVAADDDMTKQFVGSGKAVTLPSIEAVIAVNTSTLHIYFDKDVTSSVIDGVMWDSDTNALTNSVLKYTDKNGETTLTGYADQSSDNDKVLVVETSTEKFTKDLDRSDATFLLKGTAAKFAKDANEAEFAAASDAIADIEIEAVQALNEWTVRVYFGTTVDVDNIDEANFAKIGTKSDDTYATATIALTNAVEADSAKVVDFKLATKMTSTNKHYFIVNPAVTSTEISNAAGNVTIEDTDDDTAVIDNELEFAGSTKELSSIEKVSVIMTDSKTIVVYFPEAMNETEVETTTNYTVVDKDDDAVTANIAQATWKSSNNTVELTLGAELGSSTDGYYLKVANTVSNALDTRDVADEDGAAFKTEFAKSTKDATLVSIADVVYDSDDDSITVEFNMDVTTTANIETAANLVALLDITVATTTNDEYTLVAGDIASVDAVSAADPTTDAFDTIKITLNADVLVKTDEVGTVTFATDGDTKITGINGENGDEDSSKVFAQ